MISRNKILELINEELNDANEHYPLFHSDHEAYSILKEEVEEAHDLIDEIESFMRLMWNNGVRANNHTTVENGKEAVFTYAVHLIQEAIQIAAMAKKGYEHTVNNYITPENSYSTDATYEFDTEEIIMSDKLSELE